MSFFDPDNHNKSADHKRLFALCEIAYTVVDFSAAALFVIGSLLFFSESTTYVATWLFVIGSVLFGMRPTIKLYREIGYLRLGNYDEITKE
ncbi:MAG: YrhK family protein [Roseobacter sp.]